VVDEAELIVVYKRDSNSNVVRRVVHGPCVFMPDATEWLHVFQWTGEDDAEVGHMVPDKAKFVMLKTKPDFFHYYVKEVRTIDDTLITIKLMIIYELKDVFTMVGNLILNLFSFILYFIRNIS
jgi:hypothetical protein